ncbi:MULTISPECIES: hypothetical protein [unclassified Bosea (in: a-proteobacteria)]|uniref:hypothetical protein n=1 Tax=unclassified Bosea (in: a-proteobacteria) TaxID=2653178 RepID=UPI000F7F2E95|nr:MULTISPECIES: hypothetical protein [unclassified Bosea (in: a-proteobacteria)]
MVAQQADPPWTLRQTPFDLQPASGGVQTRAMQAEGLLPTLLQFCSQLLNRAEQELVTCLQPSCADAEPMKGIANEAAKPAMSANLTMPAPLQIKERS